MQILPYTEYLCNILKLTLGFNPSYKIFLYLLHIFRNKNTWTKISLFSTATWSKWVNKEFDKIRYREALKLYSQPNDKKKKKVLAPLLPFQKHRLGIKRILVCPVLPSLPLHNMSKRHTHTNLKDYFGCLVLPWYIQTSNSIISNFTLQLPLMDIR